MKPFNPLYLVGLWLLIILGMGVYQFQYELGLKKPNYKAGDCVEHDLSNEFEPYKLSRVVTKVGKEQYQLLTYSRNGEKASLRYASFNTETIKYMDCSDSTKKIQCPADGKYFLED